MMRRRPAALEVFAVVLLLLAALVGVFLAIAMFAGPVPP
jgi:hypothetical protein